jgi:hypothetical protein
MMPMMPIAMVVMPPFVAIAMTITMTVVAAILPMVIVTTWMTVAVVVVVIIQRQSKNHTTQQTGRKTEIIMGLSCRPDG